MFVLASRARRPAEGRPIAGRCRPPLGVRPRSARTTYRQTQLDRGTGRLRRPPGPASPRVHRSPARPSGAWPVMRTFTAGHRASTTASIRRTESSRCSQLSTISSTDRPWNQSTCASTTPESECVRTANTEATAATTDSAVVSGASSTSQTRPSNCQRTMVMQQRRCATDTTAAVVQRRLHGWHAHPI